MRAGIFFLAIAGLAQAPEPSFPIDRSRSQSSRNDRTQSITEQLARAIATLEGWDALNSPVRRWNNPGALVFVGQLSATRGPRGFAVFPTPEAGWRALIRDLELKIARGLTLEGIARARAGPEDDVELYVRLLRNAVPTMR